MANTSDLLYETLSSRTEVYAAASGPDIKNREYDVIIQNMKQATLSLEGMKSLARSGNLLKWLEDNSQPLTNYVKTNYPTVADDLAKHYACSALMANIFGSFITAGVGLVKEITDATGITGFSYDDLGANVAGFAGLSPQEAFDRGLIKQRDESYTGQIEGSLLDLCKKLLSLMNSKIQEYSQKADKVWNWLRGNPYQYAEDPAFFSLIAITPAGLSDWDLESNLTVEFYGSEGSNATGTIVRNKQSPTRIALIRCDSGGRYPYGRPWGYRITGKKLGNENAETYNYWDNTSAMYYASTRIEWNQQVSTHFTGSDYDFAMSSTNGPVNPYI
jgi:hypothetical protein